MVETATMPGTTGSVSSVSYVEWAPILAGAVIALSVSFVLLAFGSAVGLSVISPWSITPAASRVVLGGAFWFFIVHLWAFAIGGYMAGRLRHRWPGAVQDEVEFRDGAHGLLVWAAAMVFGIVVGSAAISATSRTAAEIAATPLTLAVDHLFRSAQPASLTSPSADVRAEAGRVLVMGRDGVLAPGDRTYLAQIVAARTGLSATDAEARVVTVSDQLKASANYARKVGIVMGFLAAATLLVAAATAWWAAVIGGAHRDEGTVWDGFASKRTLWFLEAPHASTRSSKPPLS